MPQGKDQAVKTYEVILHSDVGGSGYALPTGPRLVAATQWQRVDGWIQFWRGDEITAAVSASAVAMILTRDDITAVAVD